MARALPIGIQIAAVAAVVRGLAAFDSGASAASNQPTASAILFVGGLLVLDSFRRYPTT